MRRAALAVAGVLAAAACSTGRSQPAPSPTVTVLRTRTPAATSTRPTASAAPTAQRSGPGRLTSIGTFDQPLYVTSPPDDPRLFVVEKTGRVRILRGGRVVATPFLDLSADVSRGGEQGLLSIAFPADFKASGLVYADFTDRAGDTRVVEFHVNSTSPDRVDPSSRRAVLSVDQPYANHNGGLLLFDRDGMLLIGLGDGGSGGDPDNRAQNLGDLLGKILRIDPRPVGRAAYGIPSDNPFVGRRGARGEIWAYGLRNPWRFSLAGDGTLFLADVGQNQVEEVDVVPVAQQSGANYGWSVFEGDQRFKDRAISGNVVRPALTYRHTGQRCSITGGVRYDGPVVALRGRYLYGDACSGEVWSARGSGSELGPPEELPFQVPALSSFGADAAGEVYLTSLAGEVFRID
jgi:glucose/arabinose dehydrogenase